MAEKEGATSPLPKRKREEADDDLEIDLLLPEPLSKKDARKAKKRKSISNGDTQLAEGAKPEKGVASVAPTTSAKEDDDDKPAKRSEYGIWIGNLPFTVTKLDIRQFLCKETEIKDEDITRVHMPTSNTKGNDRAGPPALQQPKNKGFAYVDFTTSDVLAKALELSEQLVLGRRVLIKNAQSFEGRPAVDPLATVDKAGKPPSKRVFIGNLAFTVDAEQLTRHFSKCGEVVDVHVATFEDSGKCKGFAWITFEEIEAAIAAVRGYILLPSDGEAAGAKPKRRNVDRIEGRVLRREYAEDKAVRYNKRFGKGAKREEQSDDATTILQDGAEVEEAQEPIARSNGATSKHDSTAHSRRREKRQAGKADGSRPAKQKYIPHDTRPRPSKATGSIPIGGQSIGSKVSFD